MEFKELTREEFIQHLVESGWSEKDAIQEWEDIQTDDESGYDGA